MKRIFYNGNIATMDTRHKHVEAMLVEDNVIRKIGSNEEILKFKSSDTQCIDLEGKTVLPAFADTHMHVLSLGMFLRDMNLYNIRSIKELIQKSKDYIEANKLGKDVWVRGRGWNQDYFTDENRFITRYDLDKISTTNPIAYVRACGHVIVVNSRALEIMGMQEHSPIIEGGQIDLDKDNKPLGIFREQARKLVLDAIPEFTTEEIKQLITLTSKEALSHGITTIHTDDFKDVPNNYQKVIKAYEELKAEGKLKIRVYEQCNLPSVEKIQRFLDDGYYTGYGDEYFKLGPLKLLSDGSLGARTALLNEPYSDDSNTVGIKLFEQKELDDMIRLCHKNGMQVAIHAIGDGATDMVLSSIEKAKKEFPRENERHGIIHCQITNSKQIDKFKELNLIAYIQPIFLNYDISIVDDRIGKTRASTAYNWKEFIKKGVMTVGGSDCPVESLNIMENIYSAVTRKNLKGFPEEGWRPEQNLSLIDAIKIFTINAAYASFEEKIKGSISEGKLADFVVLDKDIFNIDLNEIKDVKILKTYLGGNLVYESN